MHWMRHSFTFSPRTFQRSKFVAESFHGPWFLEAYYDTAPVRVCTKWSQVGSRAVLYCSIILLSWVYLIALFTWMQRAIAINWCTCNSLTDPAMTINNRAVTVASGLGHHSQHRCISWHFSTDKTYYHQEHAMILKRHVSHAVHHGMDISLQSKVLTGIAVMYQPTSEPIVSIYS